MKLAALLLLLVPLWACSASTPYVTTVGVLKPGATLTVRVDSATVNAYQPAASQRRDLFTIAATALPKASPPPAPILKPVAGRTGPHGIVVFAPGKLSSLLVRVPDGVNLVVQSRQGDVNVTDITGNARIDAARGNVNVMVPGYAEAAVGVGNLTVTMGSTDWPGTLHFSTRRGDLNLKINAKAAFGAHLHTGDGALFTEFGLRGTASGNAESIDGSINGGSSRRVDAESESGQIRLLRLAPEP